MQKTISKLTGLSIKEIESLKKNRSLDLINLDFFLISIVIKKSSNMIKIWYNDTMSIIDNQNNGK